MFYLPELGLGANLVSCPELHAVDLRVLIWFRRESPPNDLVLVILQSQKRKTSLSKNHSQSKTKSSTDSRWSFSHPERNHFFVRRWPNALSLSLPLPPSLSRGAELEERVWRVLVIYEDETLVFSGSFFIWAGPFRPKCMDISVFFLVLLATLKKT